MASHNCFQTVVKHGFVHHSIGGIPCCGIKRIDIVGYMGISEVQTVAGKMLSRTGKSRRRMGALHISGAHLCHKLRIAAEAAGDDLRILPVIRNIADRRKRHIAADRGRLFAGHLPESTGIILIACRPDFNFRGNWSSVSTGPVSAPFRIAGNQYRNSGIFL